MAGGKFFGVLGHAAKVLALDHHFFGDAVHIRREDAEVDAEAPVGPFVVAVAVYRGDEKGERVFMGICDFCGDDACRRADVRGGGVGESHAEGDPFGFCKGRHEKVAAAQIPHMVC